LESICEVRVGVEERRKGKNDVFSSLYVHNNAPPEYKKLFEELYPIINRIVKDTLKDRLSEDEV